MKISAIIADSLYNSETGYYLTKNPIGSENDFITAPEISQIFGEVMAIYLLHISQNFNGKIALVEMGAGRGVWFYDILFAINKLAQNNSKIAI
ncbi:MAG: class I SAM-dependent methyltransferase, partial [Alphaproteobacteria bacterium]